jgi:phenylalanyl-tRNA synthetase beta chain
VHVEAFTQGAAATVETRAGRLLGVAGLVSGSERQRRALAAEVFAGEILVGAIPIEARGFLFEPYSSLPAITADISFAHPRELCWDDIEGFVAAGKLENLESLRCRDRYEGPGVEAGRVKTTIRLTFRSAERTLEQEEVNRQVRRLAEELASRPGVRLG